eukprot:2796679-Amphidinium_carterae.2
MAVWVCVALDNQPTLGIIVPRDAQGCQHFFRHLIVVITVMLFPHVKPPATNDPVSPLHCHFVSAHRAVTSQSAPRPCEDSPPSFAHTTANPVELGMGRSSFSAFSVWVPLDSPDPHS